MKSEPPDQDLQNLKKTLTAFFENREEIIFAFLFGSVARNQANLLSDIDIAVYIDPKKIEGANYPYGYPSALTSQLMSLLQTNKIDVALLNEASPALKYRIFSQGVRIFCQNPALEKKIFLKSFHEYQNTAALRQIQSFYLNRYLKNLGATRAHG